MKILNQMYKNNWQHKLIMATCAFALATSAFAATSTVATSTATSTQTTTQSSINERIEFTIDPVYPKPGSQVAVTIEAYGIDLNTSNISWTVDGKVAREGKGEKILSTTAGKEGSVTTIEATITPSGGETIKKRFFINPQTVDIIWEARTYTPPFYKGKSAYTPQEGVVFAAMPNLVNINGVSIGSRQTIYKWIKDNTVLGSLSGYGKYSYTYPGSVLGAPVGITVEASAESGQAARSNISLSPSNAEALFYEESPSLGILFNKEISPGLSLNDREKSIAVFPYFFGVARRNDPRLTYTWTMNGSRLNAAKSESSMTFRNERNEEGVAAIGMIINNDESFLQGAIGGTVINFYAQDDVTSL